MDKDELANRFKFHPANDTTGAQHATIRKMCWSLAENLNAQLPEGLEKALAITHLEEVMFWSNAAIARNS